jgi:predicted transcriptional regulator
MFVIIRYQRIVDKITIAIEYRKFMKSNITLRLDSELLRQLRTLAAEEDTSISGLLAEYLEQTLHERKAYAQARKRALGRLHQGIDLRWSCSNSRDDLHKR